MKHFLTAALLLCTVICFAQQRQNVYLLKNNGDEVATKDSADFIRIVREPVKGEVLYDVLDYYMSGKQKLISKSTTVEPVRFEGSCLTFFEGGQRSTISTYHDGSLINEMYEYFPNGKVHMVKQYPAVVKYGKTIGDNFLITEAYDSLGVATVNNGKGRVTLYDDDFTAMAEEGNVENGKRTGEWTGTDKKDTVTFKEIYADGALVEGTAIKNGKTLVYSKARMVAPEFPRGDAGFGMFLSKTIRYPAAARENNIQGRVILKFTVEKDGTLSHITVVKSVEASLDTEALRAMNSSAKWTPATKYGVPVKVIYTVPIQFALARY